MFEDHFMRSITNDFTRLQVENKELKEQINIYKRMVDMMSETIKHSATTVEFINHNFVLDPNKVSD